MHLNIRQQWASWGRGLVIGDTYGPWRTTGMWRAWAQDLWKRAERSWIERSGQDHIYRRIVVAPALRAAVRTLGFQTVIDLGCGDGTMTEMLLKDLPAKKRQAVMLFDRSRAQLTIAEKKTASLAMTRTRIRDMASPMGVWRQTDDAKLPGPRLWLSVFMVQELASADNFFANVGYGMKPGERFVVVTTAPPYVQWLMDEYRQYRLPYAGFGAWPQDFQYALAYPVPVANDRVIHLPHFQRSIKKYRQLGEDRYLALREVRWLTVPWTPATEQAFVPTVYGTEILQRPSSVMMIFERELTDFEKRVATEKPRQ